MAEIELSQRVMTLFGFNKTGGFMRASKEPMFRTNGVSKENCIMKKGSLL
jgi:hypothetical protein